MDGPQVWANFNEFHLRKTALSAIEMSSYISLLLTSIPGLQNTNPSEDIASGN